MPHDYYAPLFMKRMRYAGPENTLLSYTRRRIMLLLTKAIEVHASTLIRL